MQERLLDIYDRLLERYGRQHWWPGDGPFEIMVGAVLTQSAAWSNVEKALANLKRAEVLSPQALRDISHEALASLLYPSGYYNSKARKLKALVQYLGERYGDDLGAMALQETASLKAELLAVYGIGEETADDILLYVAGKPTFVIDAYTRRVFFRLGLAPERGPYSTYRHLFTDHLPPDPDLFGEYHALIVHHGKEVCKKEPLCRGCVLLDICPTGRSAVARQPTA